jgi:3-hydroxyacyl-CoA dehydrogenase
MQASASGSQPGQQEVRRVAVVGTGVIGASWAAYFLAQGLEVSATDPMPDAQAKLRAAVARHWPSLELLGLAPGASRAPALF